MEMQATLTEDAMDEETPENIRKVALAKGCDEHHESAGKPPLCSCLQVRSILTYESLEK